jgi:hypothetical protein
MSSPPIPFTWVRYFYLPAVKLKLFSQGAVKDSRPLRASHALYTYLPAQMLYRGHIKTKVKERGEGGLREEGKERLGGGAP